MRGDYEESEDWHLAMWLAWERKLSALPLDDLRHQLDLNQVGFVWDLLAEHLSDELDAAALTLAVAYVADNGRGPVAERVRDFLARTNGLADEGGDT